MSRWAPDAQGRLEDAALSLFAERGYNDTTVADIAERAGLTRRSFFRYFPDKREVLFARSASLTKLWEDTITHAPKDATAVEAVGAALAATAEMFANRKKFVSKRQAIINVTPELQERELVKLASMADATAVLLQERGVDEDVARLVAHMGTTVLRIGFDRWVEPANKLALATILQQLLEVGDGVVATPSKPRPRRRATVA